MYNLSVHKVMTTSVTDAGTDEKVAKLRSGLKSLREIVTVINSSFFQTVLETRG